MEHNNFLSYKKFDFRLSLQDVCTGDEGGGIRVDVVIRKQCFRILIIRKIEHVERIVRPPFGLNASIHRAQDCN